LRRRHRWTCVEPAVETNTSAYRKKRSVFFFKYTHIQQHQASNNNKRSSVSVCVWFYDAAVESGSFFDLVVLFSETLMSDKTIKRVNVVNKYKEINNFNIRFYGILKC